MGDLEKAAEEFAKHQAGCDICNREGRAICATGAALLDIFINALHKEMRSGNGGKNNAD